MLSAGDVPVSGTRHVTSGAPCEVVDHWLTRVPPLLKCHNRPLTFPSCSQGYFQGKSETFTGAVLRFGLVGIGTGPSCIRPALQG